MSSINTVAVSGRATRDPELKALPNGNSVVNLGIAVERSVKKDDAWETVANFFDVSVFGNYAELIDKKLRKGDLITVQGELRYDTWEKDGDKRSKVSIIAKTIDGQFAFRKADGTDTPDRAEGNQTTAAPVTGTADEDIPF